MQAIIWAVVTLIAGPSSTWQRAGSAGSPGTVPAGAGVSAETPALSPLAPAPAGAPAPSPTAPEDAKVTAALAQLAPADRELALRQKVGPVTGSPLGSMGPPRVVVVEGRKVFLCCKGCEAELRSDPAKYLAKLQGK